MRDLKELEIGRIVTVTRVSGSRDQKKELERMGIMSGADLTMLGVTECGLRVDTGRHEVELSDELADCIRFSAQFKREGDPMLIGGLCAGGNNTAFFEQFEKTWQQLEREEK